MMLMKMMMMMLVPISYLAAELMAGPQIDCQVKRDERTTLHLFSLRSSTNSIR